ncbi:MAG TPA: hypothetical protein DHV51_04750 [Opitutae bacterium]|nr:hypothetical protein [Opitutae bacterium]
MFVKRSAFSLVEILIVLALIGLSTTLFIANFEALHNIAAGQKPIEVVLQQALRTSRFLASQTHDRVRLSFDFEEQAFLICDEQGSLLKSIPLASTDKRGVHVDFFPKVPGLFTSKATAANEAKPDMPFDPDLSTRPTEIRVHTADKQLQFHVDAFTNVVKT